MTKKLFLFALCSAIVSLPVLAAAETLFAPQENFPISSTQFKLTASSIDLQNFASGTLQYSDFPLASIYDFHGMGIDFAQAAADHHGHIFGQAIYGSSGVQMLSPFYAIDTNSKHITWLDLRDEKDGRFWNSPEIYPISSKMLLIHANQADDGAFYAYKMPSDFSGDIIKEAPLANQSFSIVAPADDLWLSAVAQGEDGKFYVLWMQDGDPQIKWYLQSYQIDDSNILPKFSMIGTANEFTTPARDYIFKFNVAADGTAVMIANIQPTASSMIMTSLVMLPPGGQATFIKPLNAKGNPLNVDPLSSITFASNGDTYLLDWQWTSATPTVIEHFAGLPKDDDKALNELPLMGHTRALAIA